MVTHVTKVPGLPARDPEGHKGTYGTVGLLCGSEGMLGAAILCARGALRGGAGLVRACLPEALMAPFTVAVPAATTLARTVKVRGLWERADAVAPRNFAGMRRAIIRWSGCNLAARWPPISLFKRNLRTCKRKLPWDSTERWRWDASSIALLRLAKRSH